MSHSDDQPTLSLPSTEETGDLDQWFPGDSEGVLPPDEQLLADPPSNVSPEQLDAALSSPPPSARSIRLTRVLVAALVVGLTFVGGIAVGQRSGGADPVAGGPAGGRFARGTGQVPGGFPSGAPGQQAGGTTGAAAGAGANGGTDSTTAATTTTGTVKVVDGSVIYLEDADGNLTRVVVPDAADVVRTKKTTLDAISTGDSVTVTGTTNSAGVTATTVAVQR